ncbi:hypothetical protein [Yoonia sp.]
MTLLLIMMPAGMSGVAQAIGQRMRGTQPPQWGLGRAGPKA